MSVRKRAGRRRRNAAAGLLNIEDSAIYRDIGAGVFRLKSSLVNPSQSI
jgi:hypothetical protein